MENIDNSQDKEVRVQIIATESWLITTRANAKKRGLKVGPYLRQLAIEEDELINRSSLKKEIAN